MCVLFPSLCSYFAQFSFYFIFFPFSVSQQCWATSVASSFSTRWSSVYGSWPSVLSSVNSWDATTWCQPCLTSFRSRSRRRSLESFWLLSGLVEIFLMRFICLLNPTFHKETIRHIDQFTHFLLCCGRCICFRNIFIQFDNLTDL